MIAMMVMIMMKVMIATMVMFVMATTVKRNLTICGFLPSN